LRLLADSEGEPVTRDHFLDVVWGYTAFPTTRTVDNYIAKLRAKLEPDPENPKWILTVHGVGYRLDLQNRDILPNRAGQTGNGLRIVDKKP
jgi:DNA-binding response OmpR family regulator